MSFGGREQRRAAFNLLYTTGALEVKPLADGLALATPTLDDIMVHIERRA